MYKSCFLSSDIKTVEVTQKHTFQLIFTFSTLTPTSLFLGVLSDDAVKKCHNSNWN